MVRNSFLLVLFAFVMLSCTETEVTPLPYFGEGGLEDASGHYTVPKFAFINQDSIEVSHRDYSEHIYVTDFFFTTCPSICPIMTSQMTRLQDMMKQERIFGEVMILSHSIDPENDTPEVLREYADRVGADLDHWNFVTGNKSDIYDQAKSGYFMTALESDTAAGGFFHSDNFVLIDKEMHIRGYYDGTSTSSVNRLLEDIKKLRNSYQK